MAGRKGDDGVQEMLAAAGLSDGRAAYRERLKALRARDEDAFRRATSHFESDVSPRLADPATALDAWIDYGRMLGESMGPGRLVTIDATGRARPYASPYDTGSLVLFVPDDKSDDVVPAAVPTALSTAQQATIGLLVEKKLSP